MLHGLGDWVQVKTFVTVIMKTYAPIVDEDNMEKQNKFVEVILKFHFFLTENHARVKILNLEFSLFRLLMQKNSCGH